jgi:urease accessory protein
LALLGIAWQWHGFCSVQTIDRAGGMSVLVIDTEQDGGSAVVPVLPMGWQARLNLDFSRRFDFTDLRFRHEGPLRVQKPLYPEGGDCCHAVVVHPPGGIAGGDRLAMDIAVSPEAHALVTTPSASKWYGSFDRAPAMQVIDMDVQGRLEWLPCETIVFDRAWVKSTISIQARANASMFGWDLLIFGRHGSGEVFESGCFDQTLKVMMDADTVWIDRLRLHGADPLFRSPIGLNGHHALATCWAIAPNNFPWLDEVVDSVRTNSPAIAWTRLHPRLLVGRQVGCPIQMQQRLQGAWRWIKQTYWGLPAHDLRLWST